MSQGNGLLEKERRDHKIWVCLQKKKKKKTNASLDAFLPLPLFRFSRFHSNFRVSVTAPHVAENGSENKYFSLLTSVYFNYIDYVKFERNTFVYLTGLNGFNIIFVSF